MRGKVLVSAAEDFVSGITPAYAGKSDTAFNHDGAAEDHPRLCGEKFCPTARVHLPEGITPAYAGKSMQRG